VGAADAIGSRCPVGRGLCESLSSIFSGCQNVLAHHSAKIDDTFFDEVIRISSGRNEERIFLWESFTVISLLLFYVGGIINETTTKNEKYACYSKGRQKEV
jgi:hypothetical protein